jgi:putative phosphoesterase
MKIGILSDTHGDVRRTEAGLDLLLQHPIEALCHCGDIGSESVLTALSAACLPRKIPVYAVLGNVDLFEGEVTNFPTGLGIRVCGRRAELELGGRTLVVIHGDDPHLLDSALQSQRYDYCLTGHTHVADDTREGRTRVINPGALHRTRIPSVALLDLATDQLQVLRLPV